MDITQEKDRHDFETILATFQNEFAVFGARFIRDADARLKYQSLIQEAAKEIRATAVATGNFKEAAEAAANLRNEIMQAVRLRTSDIGRVFAVSLKKEGRPFETLLNNYAHQLYGRSFSEITESSQIRRIFLEVIEASGRFRPSVSQFTKLLGKSGRALWIASLGIAVYEVATAQDKIRETKKQTTSLALGSAFSVAGGWAGTACGPGAFVCVPMGVFIGGALGAFAADQLF